MRRGSPALFCDVLFLLKAGLERFNPRVKGDQSCATQPRPLRSALISVVTAPPTTILFHEHVYCWGCIGLENPGRLCFWRKRSGVMLSGRGCQIH